MPDADPGEPDALRVRAAVAEVEQAPLAARSAPRPARTPSSTARPARLVHLRSLLLPSRPAQRAAAARAQPLRARPRQPARDGAARRLCAPQARVDAKLTPRWRLQSLTEEQAAALERFCDVIVPGSARVGPAIYIDALLARMPAAAREQLRRRRSSELGELAARRRATRSRRTPTRRLPGPAGARVRGLLQRLRRARPRRDRRLGRDRLPPAGRRVPARRTGRTWGSRDERALRRRRRRVGRGRRRRRRRARGARPLGAAARAGPPPHGRRLPPLGGARRATTCGGRSASRCPPATGARARSR